MVLCTKVCQLCCEKKGQLIGVRGKKLTTYCILSNELSRTISSRCPGVESKALTPKNTTAWSIARPCQQKRIKKLARKPLLFTSDSWRGKGHRQKDSMKCCD